MRSVPLTLALSPFRGRGNHVRPRHMGTLFFGCAFLAITGCGMSPSVKSTAFDADSLALEAQSAFRQGKAQQGINLLRMCLNYNRGTDNIPAVAQNLNDLGVLSMSTGDYAAARRYLQEARPLFENLGDKEGRLSCRLNFVELIGNEGKEKLDLDEIKGILEEAKRLGLSSIAGSAQNQLGRSLMEQKRYDEAHSLFEEAVRYHQSARWPVGQTTSFHNLADVEIQLQLYEKAKEHLSQAIRIDKEQQYWQSLGDNLFLMGRALEGLKDDSAAVHHYERAFYVYRFTGNPRKMDAASQAMKRVGGKQPLPVLEESPAVADVPTR